MRWRKVIARCVYCGRAVILPKGYPVTCEYHRDLPRLDPSWNRRRRW